MAVIKGSDLMLFTDIDGEMKAIAYAKTHSLSLQAEEIEVSSKDSGKWKESQVTKLGWSASSEHLLSGIGAEDAYMKLVEKWTAREPIDVHMTVASNADNDAGVPVGGWIATSGDGLEGKANITNVELTGQDGQTATMSISLSGTGAIKKATV